MMCLWIVCAALNGFCAVGVEAWATIGLVESPVAADLVGTAVQYQMWHALALVGVA